MYYLETADNTTTYLGDGASGLSIFQSQVNRGSFPSAYSVTTTTAALTASTETSAGFSGPTYQSATNCSSSASPAVCGSAAAGSFNIAAAGTTVTVNTTAVTANSQIFLMYDAGLGTKLGVTCNATEPALYGVSARVAATSFTVIASVSVTNPICFSYFIVN
jgi:hypothetical protein